jgi:hypothetical protein
MAQENDRELARLWRVSRTAHEMIKDRVSNSPAVCISDEPGCRPSGICSLMAWLRDTASPTLSSRPALTTLSRTTGRRVLQSECKPAAVPFLFRPAVLCARRIP